ncbi:unnamed protein product [Mycena citricolor]|uniref:RING-14 protein n=1 Tax=Mycena citricolor TaxID=2018698 RepID=A0AAD2GR91_9AGAR|nr:unnamed protein product [Mycena citricolor]
MHFSKTYAQLLSELPHELSDNAIQYRQLKKLINQVAIELATLGLGPAVLNSLLRTGSDSIPSEGKGKGRGTRIVYEYNNESGQIQPRLRLWVGASHSTTSPFRSEAGTEEEELGTDDPSLAALLWAMQRESKPLGTSVEQRDGNMEIVIPLPSDSAFFQLLATALSALSERLLAIHAEFVRTLADLTVAVSSSARPVSSENHSFRVHSPFTSDAGGVRVDASSRKSDLSTWREIFQLYLQAEIFECLSERSRGERTVEDVETRLKDFAERVTVLGLDDRRRLKLPASQSALKTFFELNVFILNVKKFELANSEATRKILKKHTKRTALPITDNNNTHSLAILPSHDASLPRILVQELGTTLLPIVPSLDDYSCLICTSLAFKPIRLSCGHLFCVRCLVKMQKRGDERCPVCRSPCVLLADRSNVDWALLNFMRDWFPEEARFKLRQNEQEAAQEQMEELGITSQQPCLIM